MTIIAKESKDIATFQRDIKLAALRRGGAKSAPTQEDWLSKVKELLISAGQPKK